MVDVSQASSSAPGGHSSFASAPFQLISSLEKVRKEIILGWSFVDGWVMDVLWFSIEIRSSLHVNRALCCLFMMVLL